MKSQINNIHRYQVLKKYGLEECLYINESIVASGGFNDKAKNITYRGVEYFEGIGDSQKAKDFSNRAKSIWSSGGDFSQKVLEVCRVLIQFGVEPNVINSILGRERCDGVLYYVSTASGRPKLLANSLNRQTQDMYSYHSARLSSSSGAERATGFSISKEGLDYIKSFEGYRSSVYYATKHEKNKGMKTIGYGHVIKSDDPTWLKNATSITKEQALQIMASDVQKIANGAAREFAKYLKGPLSQATAYPQAFIDMMISLAYNAGPRGMSKSPVFNALKTARYDESTKMINSSDLKNKVLPYFEKSCITQNGSVLRGLVNRRSKERRYVEQIFSA